MSHLEARLQRVADLVDAHDLPDADFIRRGGDRRRHRAQLVTVTAALLVFAIVASGLLRAGRTSSAPPAHSVHTLRGWAVGRTVDVPEDGPALVTGGLLWVVARHGADVNPRTHEPLGAMYGLDQRTGAGRTRVDGAVGGLPVGAGEVIWMVTQAGGLDVVSRVDLARSTVLRRPTTSSDARNPYGVALAAESLWVAEPRLGSVYRMDPTSLQVTGRAQVTRPEAPGPEGAPATDGTTVYFPIRETHEVIRMDARTGRVVARITLPASTGVTVGDLLLRGTTLYAPTSGDLVYAVDVSRPGAERVVATGHVAGATTVVAGFGFVWAISHGELVQLDPATLAVTGRLTIPGADKQSSAAPGIAVGRYGLWVRVWDHLVEVRPVP